MNSQTQKVAAHERRLKCLELRIAGKSLREIARETGYGSVSGVHKAIAAALLDTLREPAEDVRALELERLDAMWRKVWQRIERGDLAAVDRGLRIQDRRAKLLGLDAPTKQEVTGKDGEALQGPSVMVMLPDNGRNDRD